MKHPHLFFNAFFLLGLIACALKVQPACSQSNFVISSTDATLLLLTLDGKEINHIPQLGLKAINIAQGNHSLALRMIDNTRGETILYDGTVYLEPFMESTYLLYRTSTYSYYLSLANKIPLAQTATLPLYGTSGAAIALGTPTMANPYVNSSTSSYDLFHLTRPEVVVKPNFDICKEVLSAGMRDTVIQAMRSYSLDSDRYRTAKIGVSSNGLFIQDVKRIMSEFSKDDTKLNFIRSVYPFICDKKNFFHLKGLFKHTDTEKQLEEYVSAVNMMGQ